MVLGGACLLPLTSHPGQELSLNHILLIEQSSVRAAPTTSSRSLFCVVCLAEGICQMSISFMNYLVPQEVSYFMVNLLFTKKIAQL